MGQITPINETLLSLREPFDKQNNFGLKFETECLFAKQQIMKNNFTREVAQNNQASLKGAIMNVAAIGISLNPASAHAYLVPRDGAICLDISYRGLVKLATDSGAIEWAKALLVYEGDTFKWRGPAQPPVHEADVFAKDRIDAADPLKNLKGGYCLAKLATGEYMVEIMTADEILQVRDTSKAKRGPWQGPWAGEMAKKTLVKRAYKSWPQSGGRERLDAAVELLHTHEGLEEEKTTDEATISQFMDLVAKGNRFELLKFVAGLSDDDNAACFNAAPKGEKTKLKDRVRGMIGEANAVIADYCAQIMELANAEDPAALDLVDELDDIERELVFARFTDIEQRKLQQLRQEAA